MGCSVAYWLASRIYHKRGVEGGIKIAVIERDPSVGNIVGTIVLLGDKFVIFHNQKYQLSQKSCNFFVFQYRYCSTSLSVGGVRQQFSLPENVEMSLFGADFVRNASKLLYVHGMDVPDLHFQPHGYLFLASEEGAETMEQNHSVQV